MSFLSGLFKDVKDFDFTWKGAKRFAKKHPIATTVLLAGAAVGVAAAFGAFAPAAVAGVPGTAAAYTAPAIPGVVAPGTGVLAASAPAAIPGTALTASTVAPEAIQAGVGTRALSAGGGAIGRLGSFFGGTDRRMMATALGAQTVGGYLSAQEAAEQAEEDRAFSREMFAEKVAAEQEARRVGYTPYRLPTFAPRGAIANARQAAPVTMSPQEANKLRKMGRI